MQRFPRIIQKDGYLMFAGFAVFMMILAANSLMDTSFGNTPPWAIVLCVVFLIAWFGVIGWFALFGLVALQTVEIDRDEIRVCLGSVVLRRISANEVKTVGIGAARGKRKNVYGLYNGEVFLVLSGCSTDKLNEKGRRFLYAQETAKLLQFAPVELKGPYAAAKAYLLSHYYGSLLWLHYTPEAEAALRNRLTTTVFLLTERQNDL